MQRIKLGIGLLTGGMLLFGAATAFADNATLTGLLACREIRAPAARLACYDRTAAALEPRVGAPRASTTPLIVPPRPLDPKKTFGLPEGVVINKEIAAGMRAPAVREITARLVGLSRAGDRRMIFTLSNGQVWRQLLPQGGLLVRVGDEVRISRGWLGSYWLKLPSGSDCKVDRLR